MGARIEAPESECQVVALVIVIQGSGSLEGAGVGILVGDKITARPLMMGSRTKVALIALEGRRALELAAIDMRRTGEEMADRMTRLGCCCRRTAECWYCRREAVREGCL